MQTLDRFVGQIGGLCWPIGNNNNNEIQGQAEESPLYVQKDDYNNGKTGEAEFVDEWEVSRSQVHLGALIGSGAFGRVHLAQLKMPGGETMVVAAKMLSENSSEDETKDFLSEISMLKHVGHHKHVIRLIACCTTRMPCIALLEHAPRGDLLTLLRSARGRLREKLEIRSVVRQDRPSEADTEYTTLSDSDPDLSKSESDSLKSKDHYVTEPSFYVDSTTMREYALQVALGMRHLEQRGITHRDLAARNILVDGTGTLKVADFGLSRSGIYVHTRSKPVPLRWLAPESIIKAQYSSASDVWAFAVLLWEIATLVSSKMASAIITSIIWMTLYLESCRTAESDKDPLIFIRNPIEGEVPGHWIPKRVLKKIMSDVKSPQIHKPTKKNLNVKNIGGDTPKLIKKTQTKPHSPPTRTVSQTPESSTLPYTSWTLPHPEREPDTPSSSEVEETTEEPTIEESTTEESTTEETTTEESSTEETTTEESTTEETTTEESTTTEAPTTEESTTTESAYEEISESKEDETEEPETTTRLKASSRRYIHKTRKHRVVNTNSRT